MPAPVQAPAPGFPAPAFAAPPAPPQQFPPQQFPEPPQFVGAPAGPGAGGAPAPNPVSAEAEGEKSFVVTWLLSYLLGLFGADRFYLGKTGTAIAKLLTLGGCGVWWIVDIIITLLGAQRDSTGLRLAGYQQHKKTAWIVSGVLFALGLILNIVTPKPVASTSLPAPTKTVIETAKPAASEAPKPTETPTAAPVEAPKPTSEAPAVPAEYRSALNKAQSYSEVMHMSKAGIYDQLTSEYGEKFSAEAAQYAVDTLKADWNANALAKAKIYQEEMSMSPDAIRDQLMSDYGEKFTPEEADYAVANLNA